MGNSPGQTFTDVTPIQQTFTDVAPINAPTPPKQYLPGRAFGMDVARGMGLNADAIADAEDKGGKTAALHEIGSQVLEGLKGVLKDPLSPISGTASNFEDAVKSGSPGRIVGALSTILGGAEGAEKTVGAASSAREGIGGAIHTPTGELTPGAAAFSRAAGGATGAAMGHAIGGPVGAAAAGTSGLIVGPSIMERMFPEPASAAEARSQAAMYQARAEELMRRGEEQESLDKAQVAKDKSAAVAQRLSDRQAAQAAKTEAARNAAPTYTPPAHTEVPLGDPLNPGPNMPIPQRLTSAQQEFLRQQAQPKQAVSLSELAGQVPSKTTRIYGPESPAPAINKTYVSYPGDMLVELAKKGDLNAVRELIRNPRGININDIPGVRYLMEQGRQGSVYGGPK
jgi:hypothetical protein